MKQISSAIIKVMESVKGMEKSSQVGSGSYGYKGTKDQDVKEVFNTELAKNGLCILPIKIEPNVTIERWQEGNKSKQSVFTEVITKYMLLHESGESIELAGYGHGVDAQDKGAGKATTYALKNCLLYTFLTPVGKIDDTDDTHSNEIKQPQKASPAKTKAPQKRAYSQELKVKGLEKGYTLAQMMIKCVMTAENQLEYAVELDNQNESIKGN